jgi:hypothetical protein
MHFDQKEAAKASEDSLENNATQEQIGTWYAYKGLAFRNINGTLRDPNMLESDSLYNLAVEQINVIDGIFNDHSASVLRETTVWRGTVDTISMDELPEELIDSVYSSIDPGSSVLQSRESLEIVADALNAQINPLKPITYRDPGYMSTTVDQKIANQFATGTTLSEELRDTIAENDELIGIPIVHELSVPPGARFLQGNSAESELVFDRESGFRITKYEVVEGPAGKFHIRAYAQMRPASGKPQKLEKVEGVEDESFGLPEVDDDDAM